MRNRAQQLLQSYIALALEVVWYGAGLLLAVFVCFLFVTPFLDPPRIQIGLAAPVTFAVDADTRPLPDHGPIAENVHIHDASGRLYFSPRSGAVAAAGLVSYIMVLAIGMFVVGHLRAVFRNLRAGKPFVPANAAHIRAMGWALIAGEIVRWLMTYAGSYYVSTRFATAGLRFDTHVSIDSRAAFSGLLLLVIAEVFREGTRLDEDQSLTV